MLAGSRRILRGRLFKGDSVLESTRGERSMHVTEEQQM